MTGETAPVCVCAGGIIVDDIVLPDGETRMEVLGGGVSHAAAGLWLWDQRPGVIARAGRDLPVRACQRLERDFDLRGIVWLDQPQARAWQLFEWDGRRTEIFRVDDYAPFFNAPPPDAAPPAYTAAEGLYVLTQPDPLPQWRARFPGATLFWEPLQHFMIAENAGAFRAALPGVDIVSPNLLEAQQVYGLDDPAALVRAMLDDGAPVVALRMGADGSLVGAQDRADLLSVPAVDVLDIVDQTGAGNTYCGGFLAGWLATGDLLHAACYGAVAASFTLEVTGIADPPPGWRERRDERARHLCERVHMLA